MRFRDRIEAGQQLAQALEKYRHQPGIVYPLPRGGVVLGAIIAPALGMPLDLVIPRKIGHPRNAEYAIGAVTETGVLVPNEWEIAQVDPAWLARQEMLERQEAKRRRERYLGDRAPLPADGKIAILVDDGVATGLTLRAAIRDIQLRRPAHIVVAVPVAPLDIAEQLAALVDDVVGLEITGHYRGAVGAYYNEFYQVSDEEVMTLLQSAS